MAWLSFLFEAPAVPKVHINLNALTSDGLIRVRLSRFDKPVKPGMQVSIYEPVDEIEGFARVARINNRTNLAYLDIAWESLRDYEPLHTTAVVETPVLSTWTAGSFTLRTTSV
jgi:hypothetical protein